MMQLITIMNYKDVITGKVEVAKLAQAKDEVLQKMRLRSTSLGFVEEGPIT